MWKLKFELVRKEDPQWHLYGLSPVWTSRCSFVRWTKDDLNYSFEILIWKCSSIIKTFKAFFSTYDLPHASQLNRFANGPACRFKCILRWDLYLNDLSHCVHLNRRLPCVVLRCVTKYRLVLKLPRRGENEKFIQKTRFQ